MGYGMHFPAHQVAGQPELWDIRGYGLSGLWVMTDPTVAGFFFAYPFISHVSADTIMYPSFTSFNVLYLTWSSACSALSATQALVGWHWTWVKFFWTWLIIARLDSSDTVKNEMQQVKGLFGHKNLSAFSFWWQLHYSHQPNKASSHRSSQSFNCHLQYQRHSIILKKFCSFYHEMTTQALEHAKHVQLRHFIAYYDRFFNVEGTV